MEYAQIIWLKEKIFMLNHDPLLRIKIQMMIFFSNTIVTLFLMQDGWENLNMNAYDHLPPE